MSTQINLKNSTDTTLSITHSDGAKTKVIDSTDIAVAIDTVADFPANPNNGDVVIVRGYHTSGDGGGGTFIYDSSTLKSIHNGGTIIDATVTFPTDWSNSTQLNTWFTTNNSGNGCWIRQYSGAVNVKWFGAKGDEVADDTLAIQKTILFTGSRGVLLTPTSPYVPRKGGTVFVPTGTYNISSTIDWPSNNQTEFVSMYGEGKPSVFKWTGAANGKMFSMNGKYDDQKKVFFRDLSFRGDDSTTIFSICEEPGYFVVNLEFSHLYFVSYKIAILAGNETDQVIVNGCQFLGGSQNSIKLINGTCSNWFVTECHFDGAYNGSTSIYHEGGTNFVCENNTFQSGTPFTMLNLKGVARVTLRNYYAEVAGSHSTWMPGAVLENCSLIALDKFHTAGSQGSSEGVVVLKSCYTAYIDNCQHSISAGTPPIWLNIDANCKDIQVGLIEASSIPNAVVGNTLVRFKELIDYNGLNHSIRKYECKSYVSAYLHNRITVDSFGYYDFSIANWPFGVYRATLVNHTETISKMHQMFKNVDGTTTITIIPGTIGNSEGVFLSSPNSNTLRISSGISAPRTIYFSFELLVQL